MLTLPRAALLLAALVLAGCSSPPPSTPFRASGGSPLAFAGYDYEGATAFPGQGAINIQVDPATDEGSVVATFQVGSATWRAEFTDFAETRPFHEGGVRNDFPEHGASGNGDALLPQFHALSAGWGTGTVSVDGAPFQDPSTGSSTFNLHYMVTDEAPRDPATRKVTKGDGTTPYDPSTPTDARTLPGTRLILLNVQSPGGELPPDTNKTVSDTATGPAYARSDTFAVNLSAARLVVNLTLGSGMAPVAVGALNVTITDPNGTVVFNAQPNPLTQGQATATTEIPPPLLAGTYTIDVSARAVQVPYTLDVLVDYPESVFWHVVYTDVALQGA